MSVRLTLIGVLLLILAGTATAVTVTAADLERAVDAYVRAELAPAIAAGERVSIACRWQQEVQVPGPEPAEIRVRRVAEGDLDGPTVLRASLVTENRISREVTLTAEIRRFRQVLVASRLIRRGEELGPTVLEVQEREVTGLADGYFTTMEQAAGMRLRRALGGGQVLTRLHAEAKPVVNRGEEVELVARGSGIEVSTEGIALEDGAVGARVRVRNAASGKVLFGQVTGAGTVRVAR
jgi:flagella basal body P-ring formation protein FlgA